MNDNTQATTGDDAKPEDKAEGFAPLPDPPSVEAEAVEPQAHAEPEAAGQEGDAPIAPESTQGHAASEPEGHGVAPVVAASEVDIQRQARLATEAAMAAVASSAAAQKIDTLSGLVLDAAELANRSATIGTAAGNKLLEAHSALEAELAKARRQSKIVLGVAAGVAVVSVVLTGAIVTQVSSRMAKLDATVLAVGKRYVEMSSGLESLTLLNDSLAEMQVKQDALAQLQAKLSANLEEANKASQGLATQVPQAMGKEFQARTQGLMQQVQSIDSRLQSQSAAVRKMADEIKTMQGQQEGLGALRRDVEALVVLQRERYLENARPSGASGRAADSAPRTLQFPRSSQAPAPEPGGSATR